MQLLTSSLSFFILFLCIAATSLAVTIADITTSTSITATTTAPPVPPSTPTSITTCEGGTYKSCIASQVCIDSYPASCYCANDIRRQCAKVCGMSTAELEKLKVQDGGLQDCSQGGDSSSTTYTSSTGGETKTGTLTTKATTTATTTKTAHHTQTQTSYPNSTIPIPSNGVERLEGFTFGMVVAVAAFMGYLVGI